MAGVKRAEGTGKESAGKEKAQKRPAERAFEASGVFREGNVRKRFRKQVKAVSRGFAKEKLLALIGSKHRTKRRDIVIEGFREIKEAKKGGE